MDSSLLLQILGASAVTAVIGSVVNAFINRRKLNADVTSVITSAAGGLVESLQHDNARLREEDRKRKIQADRRLRAVRRRDAHFRSELERHYDYDKTLVEALRKAGIAVPNPPELVFPDLDDFFDPEPIGPGTS